MKVKKKLYKHRVFHNCRKEQEINGFGACQSHVVTYKELFCLCSETGFEI